MRISDWSSDVCSSDLPENRNEAARFVTLIDALYEYKVKLLASAAAEPDRLYVAGDGAFESERTASRLAAMQSDDYLALGPGQDDAADDLAPAWARTVAHPIGEAAGLTQPGRRLDDALADHAAQPTSRARVG